MPKLVMELSKDDLFILRKVWRFNRDNLNPEVLSGLGWASMEEFCKDLLYFGFEKASDDPVGFVRILREYKSPIFKKNRPTPKDTERKFEDELRKAYA